MKQLMDGGRAGVLVPTQIKQEDVPDASVFHIINACLDKTPRERPTFRIIEETLSNAFKRCREGVHNARGTPRSKLYQGRMPTITERHEDNDYETKN